MSGRGSPLRWVLGCVAAGGRVGGHHRDYATRRPALSGKAVKLGQLYSSIS